MALSITKSLFFRQFWALCVKNWIVLSKHWILNLVRCFIGPIAFGIFLAVAQIFLSKPNNYGIGQPIPVYNLSTQFDSALSFVWADSTDGTGFPSPDSIMSVVTRGFSSEQLQAVKKVNSSADIPGSCPANFNLISGCFAALSFNSMPTTANDLTPLNYTIWIDGGLVYINVVGHNSDYEERVLPLQWAVDSAIMELTTGTQPPTPLEWPFTQQTNADQTTSIRLSYINGINQLLVIAFFVCYIGIAYQLPGSFMGERANLLTSHLQAMGLKNAPRILSWHFSISVAYLPAWIIVALVWHYLVFSNTSVWLVLAIHLLLGLSLASWSLFIAAPFGKSPQLAAVASIFFNILFAIFALVNEHTSTGAAFIFSLIFPPGFYVFSIRAIGGYEELQIPTNAIHGDPDHHLVLLPFLFAALINVFIWPYFAVLLERRLYDAHEPKSSSSWFFWRRRSTRGTGDVVIPPLPAGIAISVRNLNKTFKAPWIGSKSDVVAISDLTFDVPKTGIFVLLGSNGAGKSTALSIFAGLLGRSGGSVTFEGGVTKPPRGTIGIVPQKNVLFAELTCYQTLRVWNAIKSASAEAMDGEDIEQLLKDCDLGHKIHANAGTLSGGQKRKLQLASGLIGGSNLVFVDECTSGVDPLSRRAIWRTLTSVRNDRTIIFTTHFLDEADLLADNIAILAAPGKLVAQGSPVALKSTLGHGYIVQVLMERGDDLEKAHERYQDELLEKIRTIVPLARMSRSLSSTGSMVSYHLETVNTSIVEKVLRLVESERATSHVVSYDVHGSTMEDIFLALMSKHSPGGETSSNDEQKEFVKETTSDHVESLENISSSSPFHLDNGRRRSPFGQAFTIFHKRVLVLRRSWLTPFLTVLIAVAGTCIPIFLFSSRQQTCVQQFQQTFPVPLYFPMSPLEALSLLNPVTGSEILVSPPDVTATLGPVANLLRTVNEPDNATLVNVINTSYKNLSLGGISLDAQYSNSLVAWEATPPGLTGPTMLNLASNILYNHALNASGSANTSPHILAANLQNFPGLGGGVLVALKWIAFFGAATAVYPAFFALYVSNERRSSVQAMQLSNGLSNPVGLWLGHLMFDTIFSAIIATVCVIVYAAASNQFQGLGFFWLALLLYGITGALFAYCVTLITTSPLAAFAVVAAYQVIMFVLYTAGYLLTLTYAKSTQATSIINIIHFTVSILSPVASILRAAFVSVNLFSLLCNGNDFVTAASLGQFIRFGGPITYLIIYSLILFAILVWYDSGLTIRSWSKSKQNRRVAQTTSTDSTGVVIPEDVKIEALAVAHSHDPLLVQNISKTFGKAKTKAVDNVAFGVSNDTILALLGPNGAGKTSTFNIIRGDIVPDSGDVLVEGTSVVYHPQTARLSLGVCPQFTAIDSQLTVREHLMIYGRLKGLRRGAEVQRNVEAVMKATTLSQYADRLASKLSGGNQRKLSLAIALIGNPSVILIDEFSTGIDAKNKRDMWVTLKNVAVGKVVVITTHSMEEASALANKVGIIAGRMLAIGPLESLAARYPIYEIHFSCRTREEVTAAQQLMARISGSKMADDLATRFEVPLEGPENRTLAGLFQTLSDHGQFSEYTVERVSLESIFLKVIRENNVEEEDISKRRRRRIC